MKNLFLMAALFFPLCTQAQTDEFRKSYDEFKQQSEKKYNDFREKANKEYAEFMRKAWKEHKQLPAIPKPKDETTPPVVMPEDDRKKPIKENPVPIKEVVTPPKPQPQPVPVAPIREKPVVVEKNVAFNVYGTQCNIRKNDKLQLSLGNCDNDQVADAWESLSADGVCDNTIRDCLETRISLQLSDWAYLNMLSGFAETIFGKGNEATLLTAYLFCQSGYKMRLGLAGNSLRLLYSSRHLLFDNPYFQIDDEKFYPFNGKETSMDIFESPFPQENSMSFYIDKAQLFTYKASPVRTLTSKRYPAMSAKVSVNTNLIDFYNTYPTSTVDNNFMTRWAMYANTPMEKEVQENLYPQLRKNIDGLSEKEAVERLLNWVQTAFVYEYDDKVWGGDRAFFAEESLYYPYCDCEDRSILLTRLVRDLLGLDCILIYYPGHLASAVCFNTAVNGDYIELGGRRFTVCDGTYINAPIGKTMPGMDNKTATVILLDK